MKLALPPEGFALEVARAEDFEELLALRLRAMRPSLERLGRYDERRARLRLADGFDPARAQHIVMDGVRVGFFVLKPLTRAWRGLGHFYIGPTVPRGSRASDRACCSGSSPMHSRRTCRWNWWR